MNGEAGVGYRRDFGKSGGVYDHQLKGELSQNWSFGAQVFGQASEFIGAEVNFANVELYDGKWSMTFNFADGLQISEQYSMYNPNGSNKITQGIGATFKGVSASYETEFYTGHGIEYYKPHSRVHKGSVGLLGYRAEIDSKGGSKAGWNTSLGAGLLLGVKATLGIDVETR